jgi:uncharacterized protein (DUF983 family)
MIESRAWLKWLLLAGGPIVWGLHFTTIYAASGLDHTFDSEGELPAKIVILLAGVAALGALSWLFRTARALPDEQWSHDKDLARFWRRATSILHLLTMLAIFWATLPVLLVNP